MIYVIVLFVWLVIMFGVGLWAGKVRPITTREDWSVAGRTFRWITNYFTAHATQLSALQFMGFPALMYLYGLPLFYAHYTSYMLGTCGFFVLFATKLWRLGKRYGDMTPADALTRYWGGGKWFGYLWGALQFWALIPYIQVQVLGAGLVFDLASGGMIPVWLGALITYAVVTIYVWYGGMRAVAYTDVLQGAMLLFGLWVGSLGIIQVFGGGIPNIISSATAKLPQLMTVSGYKGWDWPYTISWALAFGAGWGMHAHMWIRQLTPRSERDSRIWTGIIFAENFIHAIFLFLAMLAVALVFPGIKVPDLAFLQTLEKLNPIMYALVLAAVSAAIFSTIDSQVHVLGLIVTHDFIERSGRQMTDRQFIWANRLTVLIAMAAGYILAMVYPGPLGILGMYPAAIGFMLYPPVLAMLTAQRWVTKEGVVAGLIAGGAAAVLTGPGPYANPLRIHFGVWALVANAVVMSIVSLFTKTRPPEDAVRAVIEAGW